MWNQDPHQGAPILLAPQKYSSTRTILLLQATFSWARISHFLPSVILQQQRLSNLHRSFRLKSGRFFKVSICRKECSWKRQSHCKWQTVYQAVSSVSSGCEIWKSSKCKVNEWSLLQEGWHSHNCENREISQLLLMRLFFQCGIVTQITRRL